MASHAYDVIVVGAGIEGSSTAYQLAKRGQHVLLIDQFPLPHVRGSSHGHTRITRKAYGKDQFYTAMMEDAYEMTEQLEREAGEQLFINCGCMLIGEPGNEALVSTVKCFKRFNIPYEEFGSDEQRRRYPNMLFPDDYVFLLDKSGGVLKADKILRAYQNQLRKYGGDIKDGEEMQTIVPGDPVTVVTSKNSYKAGRVVLALGSWAVKCLPKLGLSLPLKPVRITVNYWKEKTPGEFQNVPAFGCSDTSAMYGSPSYEYPGLVKPVRITVNYWKEKTSGEFQNFPAFACRDKNAMYGSPSDEYPGLVKICHHNGPEVDPDDINNVDNQWVTDKMTSFISEHFPTLENRPIISEPCIYTMTPDSHFILDSHPKWRNIIIGAGFSGHGFKLAPVVGCILADLAMGIQPSYDMGPFSITRFTKHKL